MHVGAIFIPKHGIGNIYIINNVFLAVCLQFADSSEGLGCTQCPEGWKLERWLLLNPNKHDVHRTLLI